MAAWDVGSLRIKLGDVLVQTDDDERRVALPLPTLFVRSVLPADSAERVPKPARELVEVINVRGSEPVSKTIRFSRNGPVVDEILPTPARETGPVTLKWLGMYQGGWLTALLQMGRVANVREFRSAERARRPVDVVRGRIDVREGSPRRSEVAIKVQVKGVRGAGQTAIGRDREIWQFGICKRARAVRHLGSRQDRCWRCFQFEGL